MEECNNLEEAFIHAKNKLHFSYKMAWDNEEEYDFIKENGIIYLCKINHTVYAIACKGEYKENYICKVVQSYEEEYNKT